MIDSGGYRYLFRIASHCHNPTVSTCHNTPGDNPLPPDRTPVSKVSVPANAQFGIVRMEMEWEVAAGCSAVAVRSGMRSEWKTGPCAAFDVEVVGQETNTTQGMSSNSGVSTRVCLPFRAGMGMGTEMGVETNGLGVAGGLRAACSWERT